MYHIINHRSQILLFFFGVFSLLSCKSTTGPQITLSNSGDQIFYHVIWGGDSTQIGIHSINIDGTSEKLLYHDGVLTCAPRAGKLVFIRYNKGKEEDSTTFYLGDITGGSESKLFTIEEESDYAILSPDGQKIIYDDSANDLCIYDLQTGTHSRVLPIMELSSERPIISDDSKTILSAFNNPQTGLFLLGTNLLNPKLISDDGEFFIASEIHQVYDLSPDLRKLCYRSAKSGHLKLHDILSGSEIIDTTFYGLVEALSWSPKGDRIAFASSKDGSYSNENIVLFDTANKTTTFSLPILQASTSAVQSIDWSKDEKYLFIVLQPDETYSEIIKMDVSTGAYSIFNTQNPIPGGTTLGAAYRSRDLGEH